MDELIEKLRILQSKNSLSLYKREVCRDAADAIERLQAEAEHWKQAWATLYDVYANGKGKK